jgi:hypothetical protein
MALPSLWPLPPEGDRTATGERSCVASGSSCAKAPSAPQAQAKLPAHISTQDYIIFEWFALHHDVRWSPWYPLASRIPSQAVIVKAIGIIKIPVRSFTAASFDDD